MLLLLAVAVTSCGRRHHIKKRTGLLIGDSEDDIRDNVLNYDEQGGGEEDEVWIQQGLLLDAAVKIDCICGVQHSFFFFFFILQNAFNIDMLWNPHDAPSTPGSYRPVPGPRGKQPLRKDAPHNLPSPAYPRRPPADPTDIEDYINDV